MYISEVIIRVRYSETDQMGYVYYGNYAQYYEVGRVEAFRRLGTSYKSLEESGYGMPVLSMQTKYIKPAHYDEHLKVRTIIKELPQTRMKFEYEIFNEKDELINIGETVLVFVSLDTKKSCKAPPWFIELLEKELCK